MIRQLDIEVLPFGQKPCLLKSCVCPACLSLLDQAVIRTQSHQSQTSGGTPVILPPTMTVIPPTVTIATKPTPYGWVCPRCETVYAPSVISCQVCSPKAHSEPQITARDLTGEITINGGTTIKTVPADGTEWTSTDTSKGLITLTDSDVVNRLLRVT